jgi:hypothetical protein
MADETRSDELSVRCPCCEARLEVDRETGEVLHATPAKSRAADFDAALGEIDEERMRREDDFQRAFRSERSRQDVLAKKFDRARGSAGEDDET